MKKIPVYFAIIFSLFLVGCENTGQNVAEYSGNGISLERYLSDTGKETSKIYALYDHGYDTIEELMSVGTLVVKATPVSVESESAVGICWILDVAESSEANIETIKLRQVKDKHMLTPGQEVVLVVQPDIGEGYYHIPGGGCGLFFMNQATNTADGFLMSSLLERMPAVLSANHSNTVDLDDVFTLLAEII